MWIKSLPEITVRKRNHHRDEIKTYKEMEEKLLHDLLYSSISQVQNVQKCITRNMTRITF